MAGAEEGVRSHRVGGRRMDGRHGAAPAPPASPAAGAGCGAGSGYRQRFCLLLPTGDGDRKVRPLSWFPRLSPWLRPHQCLNPLLQSQGSFLGGAAWLRALSLILDLKIQRVVEAEPLGWPGQAWQPKRSTGEQPGEQRATDGHR